MRVSAGLLMYRIRSEVLEVFLIHPGGPFFKNKDEGYWGIPKGEVNEGEPFVEAAKREFREETGIEPGKELKELGEIKQKGGKHVHAWAFEGDWSGILISNYFSMEWPIRSGKMISIPEVDKAGFFSIKEAKKKMNSSQFELVERLVAKLNLA